MGVVVTSSFTAKIIQTQKVARELQMVVSPCVDGGTEPVSSVRVSALNH